MDLAMEQSNVLRESYVPLSVETEERLNSQISWLCLAGGSARSWVPDRFVSPPPTVHLTQMQQTHLEDHSQEVYWELVQVHGAPTVKFLLQLLAGFLTGSFPEYPFS